MDNNNVIRLGLDLAAGVQKFNIGDKEYSAKQASDVLRQALIEANGGSTKIDRKTLRRNKADIFEIIEILVPSLIKDGLSGDEFWMNYVDEQNLAAGDQGQFYAPDNSTFVVAEIADGIATPRRQRIGKATTLTITPQIHAIRMYDEFSRFMAGRIDWNELINKVTKSFNEQMWNDIYTAFSGISASTQGLSSTYVKTGSYSESTLLELIEHVEAATGARAVLVGTKAALRKCTGSVMATEAKTAMYNEGFYGMFNGTPMMALSQKHKLGTDTFILNDSVVYVLASDDKFVKFVNEGDAFIDDNTTGMKNADMTVEFFMTMKWGCGVLCAGKLGKYTIS